MRIVTLHFDREYGGWPYRASTEVEGAPESVHGPAGVISAGGPTEEAAIENLKRVVGEWVDDPIGKGYPKVVEVDW